MDTLSVVSAVGVPLKLASIIIPPPEQYSSAQGPPSRSASGNRLSGSNQWRACWSKSRQGGRHITYFDLNFVILSGIVFKDALVEIIQKIENYLASYYIECNVNISSQVYHHCRLCSKSKYDTRTVVQYFLIIWRKKRRTQSESTVPRGIFHEITTIYEYLQALLPPSVKQRQPNCLRQSRPAREW